MTLQCVRDAEQSPEHGALLAITTIDEPSTKSTLTRLFNQPTAELQTELKKDFMKRMGLNVPTI